jgi:hypothetical protein
VDRAGREAVGVSDTITVEAAAPAGTLKLAILFHANQTLNYQGDTANDLCFNGLVSVCRQHPASRFMMHFSGSLLHDLLWFDYRHSPSTIEMLRAGAADGQFEIVGSTYAQNVPYATHMWDNDVQVKAQREVIETALGVVPVTFWNAERCWKQQLVPLIADNGYTGTWVETHIIYDSGTSAPEHALRKTRIGDSEVLVFNDDGQIVGLLDYAIDTGETADLVDYLAWLHGEDTYRDFILCYCQDMETSGLWDYEWGQDPQEDWDNFDHVLDVLEGLEWLEIVTLRDYLGDHRATEMLVPIVDGQANWMVGPSQGAGYDDWFDYNENSPLLAFYRDFYTTVRERIQQVSYNVDPLSAAGRLVHHAHRHFAAHQFEFGCINCGDYYCQDYHKLETVEATCLAVEYAVEPVASPEIVIRDANGDSIADIVLVTPTDLFVFSAYGGRLLYWFDLVRGEEIVGNELFMWGYYYIGWREFYSGGNYNDDFHYTIDYEWNAPHQYPAAAPFQRFYRLRKKCFSEFFSFGGAQVDNLVNDELGVAVIDDTVRFTFSSSDFDFVKSFYPSAGGLSAAYEITNKQGITQDYTHRVENSFSPSLVAAMDHGRGSLMYTDGPDTSSAIGPGTAGVTNVYSGTTIDYLFSPEPDALSGTREIFAIQLSPEYSYSLGSGQSRRYGFSLVKEVETAVDDQGGTPRYRNGLEQNFPNPFNPSTTVGYSVGARGRVRISIYDVSGRLVRTLYDEVREPGAYSIVWDGRNDAGRAVGSGIYFCRMESGQYAASRKLILMR